MLFNYIMLLESLTALLIVIAFKEPLVHNSTQYSYKLISRNMRIHLISEVKVMQQL